MSKYNLMEIIELMHLNSNDAISGGLEFRVIKGYRVWLADRLH